MDLQILGSSSIGYSQASLGFFLLKLFLILFIPCLNFPNFPHKLLLC